MLTGDLPACPFLYTDELLDELSFPCPSSSGRIIRLWYKSSRNFFSSFKFHISCDVPRCVPGSQGSFALGVQQIITRILAFIPAPIVYGALLDSVCLLSESDPCNEDVDRNCLEYRNDGLRYGVTF